MVSEKRFEYYGNIHMYIAPGWGQIPPRVHFFSKALIFSPTVHFVQDSPFK